MERMFQKFTEKLFTNLDGSVIDKSYRPLATASVTGEALGLDRMIVGAFLDNDMIFFGGMTAVICCFTLAMITVKRGSVRKNKIN